MPVQYDAVLLDADETLFDFSRSSREALLSTWTRYGFPASEGVVSLYKEHNNDVWGQFEHGEISRSQLQVERFARLFADLGVQAEPADFNKDYMDALSRGVYLLPGAEKLCQALYPACPLYIVTNGFTSTQQARMERSPLKQYIRKMYISEEIGFQKPRGEYFDAVFADMGLSDRRRVILLGDSLTSDMRGGIGAGIRVCWYNPAGKASGGLPIDYEIRYLLDFLPIVLPPIQSGSPSSWGLE